MLLCKGGDILSLSAHGFIQRACSIVLHIYYDVVMAYLFSCCGLLRGSGGKYIMHGFNINSKMFKASVAIHPNYFYSIQITNVS